MSKLWGCGDSLGDYLCVCGLRHYNQIIYHTCYYCSVMSSKTKFNTMCGIIIIRVAWQSFSTLKLHRSGWYLKISLAPNIVLLQREDSTLKGSIVSSRKIASWPDQFVLVTIKRDALCTEHACKLKLRLRELISCFCCIQTSLNADNQGSCRT